MTVIQVDVTKLGRRGGQKRAENLTPEQLSEIGRKGAAARWGPKKKPPAKKKK